MVALSDTSGTIEASYSYDVFGDATVTGDEHGNPYRFTGRRYDDETDLYYYRARMYAPNTGRFLQPDPIGYDDGMNMYAYVGNNPASFVDPFGLISLGMILNIHAVYNAPEEGIYLFEPQAAMTAMGDFLNLFPAKSRACALRSYMVCHDCFDYFGSLGI